MARLFIATVILSVAFMTIARPADPEPGAETATTAPAAPAAPASSGGPQQNMNQGVFVNGFNCTSYISQCKNGQGQLTNGSSAVPVTPPPEQAAQQQQMQSQMSNQTNVCDNPQAQTMCGGLVYNPVTTNLQNSTIINQNQNFTQIQNQGIPFNQFNASSFPMTPPPGFPLPTSG